MDAPGLVRYFSGRGSDVRLQYLAARLEKEFPVLFIDCCNTFDPYYLYRACRDESVLDRIYVSRPFTVYQMRELIFCKLEAAIQRLLPRALFVSGIDSYEADNPLDEKEYEIIKGRVLGRIKTLSSDYVLPTYISSFGGE